MADWHKRRVTVLGLGRSGVSAARYLAARGAEVFVSDEARPDSSRRADIDVLKALGVRVETGTHSDAALAFGEIVVTSPGISPQSPVIERTRRLGKEIISDIELAYRETTIPIIAVTGTNGKSTTTALISHLLSASGKKAPACGNIGVPMLDQLAAKPDFLVVEVSSYQLEYSTTLAPFIGVWLNLTPDHLDWHGTLDHYIRAKRKMFERQGADQYAVLNNDDKTVVATRTRAEIFPFSIESSLDHAIQGAFLRDGFLGYRLWGRSNLVCHPRDLLIIGRHNLQNALAAIAAAALAGASAEAIKTHIKTFKPLEHRLEFVAEVDGIKFYNDSKATNPESSIKALEAFPDQKVVLIAGGKDKGTSLEGFVRAMKAHASNVILLGEAKERFKSALEQARFENVYLVDSMEAAVDLCCELKQGPVLLSPACASFDMFRDYEDRGRVFKDLVRARLERLAPSI